MWHFTDDGISGTRFDRPGFMAMMDEIEDGNVDVVLVKDLSRVGRDYLKVGMYMETMCTVPSAVLINASPGSGKSLETLIFRGFRTSS